ncbi:PHB domain-containing protein [Trichostrongylus colubriformis]|uniref:PHB domain-containing protein n=1 Tax=Trichostrongylus colubriformis TaxID=6319 RepID=A0AAN8FEK5_TRICO
MTFPSVRYAALLQDEQDDHDPKPLEQEGSGLQFGVPEGMFDSVFTIFQFVSTSEKLVVLRLGRAQKTRGPGATLIVPCIDTTFKVSTTVTAFNVPPLQVITVDRGLVELGATVFLRIRDPVSAVCSIQDRNTSTRTLANTMLYRYISKRRVCEVTNGHDRRILAATLKVIKVGPVDVHKRHAQTKNPVPVDDREGENMGLEALSAVVKSDAGVKLWEVIAPHVEEFAREMKSQAAAKQSGEPMDPVGDSPGYSSATTDTLIDIEPSNDANENLSIDEERLINAINMAIDEPMTKAVGCVFQINCPGTPVLVIDLKHPPGSCTRGTPSPNPDVIFELSRDIFLKIIKEEVSPVAAYIQGSLKIYGSLQDAMSLKCLAERVKHLL